MLYYDPFLFLLPHKRKKEKGLAMRDYIIIMFTEFCKQEVSNSATVLVGGADSTSEMVQYLVIA